MAKIISLGIWRTITLTIISIGAIVSLVLMFNAGRNQKSILLISLFTAWVISPFVVLFITNLISHRWNTTVQRTLYILAFAIVICSLACYSGVWSLPDTKPAFMFLMVPLVSLLLLTIGFLIIWYSEKSKT